MTCETLYWWQNISACLLTEKSLNKRSNNWAPLSHMVSRVYIFAFAFLLFTKLLVSISEHGMKYFFYTPKLLLQTFLPMETRLHLSRKCCYSADIINAA